jgi:hypothetical protein
LDDSSIIYGPYTNYRKITEKGLAEIGSGLLPSGVVFALIAWGLVYLLQFIKPVTPIEVEEQVG